MIYVTEEVMNSFVNDIETFFKARLKETPLPSAVDEKQENVASFFEGLDDYPEEQQELMKEIVFWAAADAVEEFANEFLHTQFGVEYDDEKIRNNEREGVFSHDGEQVLTLLFQSNVLYQFRLSPYLLRDDEALMRKLQQLAEEIEQEYKRKAS
ncbi:hypothetical protein IMZ31_20175 (plasmid) [Pontibacillus sp. ALD_SL1]|uniref:hypothetical protein n=1 Tax=Pontibacillus sp. ALD_SL1 TaxID=2777185 RepID=UPI001A9624AB|nr:hypothetical protein [Pontibacillus sp. ALD_SL1]QST02869.1 hypothetical protein IMZ31_20175 [Pontibacillus sp. ALD_SL1]